MDVKFYHYSVFVAVQFSKSSENADIENGNRKVQCTELCKVDTNNEGLTFSSQILFMSSKVHI